MKTMIIITTNHLQVFGVYIGKGQKSVKISLIGR